MTDSQDNPATLAVFLRQLAVTVVALTVYWLALHIPLPGIDHVILIQSPDAISRLSVMALGFLPWLSALTLAEAVCFVCPERLKLPFRKAGHADPFSRWVLVGAIAFTVLQGFGIVQALLSSDGTVVLSEGPLLVAAIGSYLGATALCVLVAQLISRHGVGWGFWVLLADAGLGGIWDFALSIPQVLTFGTSPATGLLLPVLMVVAAVAALVALVLARRNMGLASYEPLVWPILLYAFAVPYIGVLAFGTLGQVLGPDEVLRALQPDRWPGAVLAAALLFLICYRYARRHRQMSLFAFEAALLSALTCVSAGATWWLGIAMPGGAPFVVLIVVLTLLADRLAKILRLAHTNTLPRFLRDQRIADQPEAK
jgi:hypothetical protein